MSTIRPESVSVGGLWARDVSRLDVSAGADRAGASERFSDFSRFAGQDARVSVGGRLDAEATVGAVMDALTSSRNPGAY